MNTKLVAIGRLVGLITVLGVSAQPSSSNGELLSVKPNRCVALRHGQYCYQKLQFVWQNTGDDRTCLYESDAGEPLACWGSRSPFEFNYQFKSTVNKTFLLKNERTQTTLSEVEVVVAWVYKSSKKVSTGWRLF